MKYSPLFVSLLFVFSSISAFSQAKKEPVKEKKSLLDKVSELPDVLISQKEKVDTNASRFIQDILSIEVPPIWKEKGVMLFNDLKLNKTDKEPLNTSLPLPAKKIIQGVTITLNSIKKSPADKKAMTVASIKSHLVAFYKDAGTKVDQKELDEQVNSMISAPQSFTTSQGKTGDLYFINDIQTQQSSYIILLIVPDAVPNFCHFVQFQYYRFIYETTIPEDVMEWKTFVYPDEQEVYVNFTKDILKTLVINK
ncbi:MAG: hypothetical protein IPP77_01655 [Bacteroidetes bacterium]|nr:hypothetical protein [Bacteroidota bacterium]